MRIRLPGLHSLPGQLSLLVLGILLLAQLVSFYLYFTEVEQQYFAVQGEDRIRRLVAVMHAVERADLSAQAAILTAASDDEFFIYIADRAIPASEVTEPVLLARLATLNQLTHRSGQLTFLNDLKTEEHLYYQQLVTGFGEDFQDLVLVGLPLQDGRWLYATLFDRVTWFWSGLKVELYYSLPAFVLVAVLVLLAVRRLTHPLSLLADKATHFGRGESFQALPIRGTDEIRQATRAFNAMAERLQRHVSDRQQLLAAISHDLRSPLTGMRIQAEFIQDESVHTSIIAGIEEMQQMITSVLRFTREDAENEPVTPVDVRALLQSLTEQYQLQQQTVRFTCTDSQRSYAINTRPLALKRSLRNLLENALKYGKCADIALSIESKQLLITITDQGPGIPPADLERVFEPFTQLDHARPASRSGIGMGLSVARSLLRALGGDVTLANRTGTQRGLQVTVQLPP